MSVYRPAQDWGHTNYINCIYAFSIYAPNNWSLLELCTHSANPTFVPDLVDLEGIPKDYHDFADVFSKIKADMLATHQPYNLRITLEDGASHPSLF